MREITGVPRERLPLRESVKQIGENDAPLEHQNYNRYIEEREQNAFEASK